MTVLNQESKGANGQTLYTSGATQADVSSSISAQGLTPTSVINSQNLAASTPYSLPQASTSTTPPAPAPDFKVAQAQADFNQSNSDLKSVYDLLGGATAKQQSLENTAGVPDLQKRLGELQAIDAGYVSDLSHINSQQLQGTAAQQGTSTSELGRQINLKDLNYSAVIASQNVNIQRATNNAVVASVQGQLANAQANIQRALDLEFKPLQQKVDYLSTFLKLNADKLSTAEQNQLQYQITQQKQSNDIALQNKKDIYSVLTTAAQNGADNATLQKIQNAANPMDAVALAGHYLNAKDLQFVSGTATQPAGYFDKTTGKFTATGGVGTEQLYSGLSSSTATAARGVVTKFGTEPLIQNFATIQDGYNFASSMNDNTTNPADDQALVYAFAKAMDPGSVVREGEYNTVQKYAQSWVQAYGKSVSQAIAGTGFLTPEARKNLKTVIENKYTSSKKSYDQIQSSYVDRINSLTGRSDGAKFLTDYVTPQTKTYTPGTTLHDSGILYLVGADGETVTPIGNYAG